MYVLHRSWYRFPLAIYEPENWPYLAYGSLYETAGDHYGPHIFLLRVEAEFGGQYTIHGEEAHLVPPQKAGLNELLGWVCFHPTDITHSWYLGEHPQGLTMEKAKEIVMEMLRGKTS